MKNNGNKIWGVISWPCRLCWKDERGTALLVSLLVMGVLIAVSLATSSLIFRESRITNDLLDSGKAYYAAESGIEIALYNLKNNLPGWQPTDDGSFADYKVGENSSGESYSVGELKVDNNCKAYPCFDEGEFEVESAQPKAFYDYLDLNESITIPLFSVDENNTITAVKHFVVEFFAPFSPEQHLKITSDDLDGWDVLRWKLFGITKNSQVTESISDFTAFSSGFSSLNPNDIIQTNAQNPSWFGTALCTNFKNRYRSDIKCRPYAKAEVKEQEVDGQISKIYDGICLNTQAREYYSYRYDNDGREVDSINPCYDIGTFLYDHKLNYLTLTNLVNPAVFKDVYRTVPELQRIYFRIEIEGDEEDKDGKIVREFADITANGYSGDSKQSINVKIKRDSFIPVFHFSLYSTYKDKDHDFEYFYGKDEAG